MTSVEECHNFATKTEAAFVARNAAFLVHGQSVVNTESANDAEKNGRPNGASKDFKRRFPNGRKSYVSFSKIALEFELQKQLVSNAAALIVCFIICEYS